MKSKTLEYKVRHILANHPKTRDSDITLTQYIWWAFHRDSLKQEGAEIYVNVNHLHNLPREDNIKRIRARIQNEEHKYPPTNIQVAKQRKWNEQQWRDALGYRNKDVEQQEKDIDDYLKQIGLL